ncbi:cell division ATP-binding protein FtsE [Clavibacter michiganensis]|uniref:cell division ATP-binding protein FtsE n=1 Tax=Clavibacter michiganensis TaxID=28447 RepID=UPI0020B1741F|nr:cell division ATP-binding protein FtsE [Clavibacter michiganensis]
MIRFDHVSKVYPGNPRPALSSVDLEILRGEFVFLVGASGSGKSSFLRLVLKEDRPTNGTIHVLGQQLNQLSSRKVPYYRRSLGVVFQDFRLLPNKSVFDNVAFTLQVIGKSRGFIQEAVPDVLAMVGLQGKEQRLPHELSGGEQQRVAIARAVVNKPAVLLADEPTGNLDPLTSAGIMQVLERINANGTTVIMATHDSGIVDQMQKRVIELIGGEVVRDEVGGQYQTSAIDLPRTAENPVGVNPEHPPVAAPTPVFVPAAPLPAPVRPTAPAEPANAAERREQARRDKQRRADEKARAKEEATREAAAAKASRKPAKGADAPAAVAAPASATPSAAPSAAPAEDGVPIVPATSPDRDTEPARAAQAGRDGGSDHGSRPGRRLDGDGRGSDGGGLGVGGGRHREGQDHERRREAGAGGRATERPAATCGGGGTGHDSSSGAGPPGRAIAVPRSCGGGDALGGLEDASGRFGSPLPTVGISATHLGK